MRIDWRNYFLKTATKPPNPLLVEALTHVRKRGTALDLGAGALRDSKYLLSEGFENVIAIDPDPASKEYADSIDAKNFTFKCESFDQFDFAASTYDLINAQRSIPFVSAAESSAVMDNIRLSLASGGILCAVLFGIRNSLHGTQTLLTREQVDEMLYGMEVIKLDEVETDKPSVMGVPTHFHEFYIIARKKAKS